MFLRGPLIYSLRITDNFLPTDYSATQFCEVFSAKLIRLPEELQE